MKKTLFTAALCVTVFLCFSQNDKVYIAEIALDKGDLASAYENANAALQAQKSLDKTTLAKACFIRGKAGLRISYDALMNGTEEDEKKYADVPLQCYKDFQQALLSPDTAMKKQVAAEYNKMSNALLVAGTRYDQKFKDAEEKADSAWLDKAIENFSASIEIHALMKKEKFKPYLFRGDAWFAKMKFDEAANDYLKALELFENSKRDIPDFNIGDLGYRLAYMQAAVYKKKEVAMQTIEKTRKLLDGEMSLAEAKKEKLGERYEDCKKDYQYFKDELNELTQQIK